MKISKILLLTSVFFVINACKKTDVEPLTTKQCLLTNYTFEDFDLINISYDKNKISNISLDISDDPFSSKVSLNTAGDIIKLNLDDLVIDVIYTGDKVTKITEKQNGQLTGEKIVTYIGNNLSKLEYFIVDKGVKTIYETQNFTFNNEGNLTKYSIKSSELGPNDILLFEEGVYDKKANQFNAISKNMTTYFLCLSDIFIFTPAYIVSPFLSKNNLNTGKFKSGFLEALFGNTVPSDINKAFPNVPFINTYAFSPEGYPRNTSTTFTDKNGKQTSSSALKYNCL